MMNRVFAPLLGAAVASLMATSPGHAQQAIRAGQTVNGTLAASDPKLDDNSHFDLYVYRGTPGERIVITMRSTAFDAMLAGGPTISGGRVQAADMDDDGGGGTDAEMQATVPASGAYYFHANSLSGGQTGAYTVSVQAAQGGRQANADPAPTPAGRGGQGQPGTIQAGQTIRGSLATSDPKLDDDSHYDMFVYRGQPGESIIVTLRSSDFDAYLAGGTMRRGTLNQDASDDDGGGGTNARMEATVGPGGEYAIRVNSVAAGETGDYTLNVERGQTARRQPRTAPAATIRSGQSVQGQLTASDPKLGDNSYYDLYTYQGTPGEAIEITMSSSAFDAYLGGGGSEAEAVSGGDTDDDGAGGTDARLRVEVGPSGRYVIRANSLRADVTGAYTLSVQPAGRVARRGGGRTSPGGEATGNHPAVRMGQTVTGRLEASDPKLDDGSHYDVYTYSGSPGEEIVITLSSSDFDPYLTLARSIGGEVQRVAQDDDSGPGNNAQVRATLDARGSYMIVANSFSADETGRYSLVVQSADQVPTSAERGAASGMTALRTGQPVTGRLERSDAMLSDSSYADNYLYRGVPGEEVLVTLRSTDFDAFLTVASTDGEDVSDVRHDDDGGGGTNAQMRVRVDENGLYLVRANSVAPRATGSYTLTVERASTASTGGNTPSAQRGNRSQLTGKWVAGYPAVHSPQYATMRQQAQAEQRMETFAAQLNTNFPLPRNVPLVFGECGDPNAFYSPSEGRVTFCYEMIEYLNSIFSRSAQNPAQLRESMDGAFAFIMMHEVGHALRHQLDLPVTGREEDAADQLAALVLLQDGDKGANAAVAGALALQTGNQFDDSDYADEHSLGPQRLYNIVCWIYGSDPVKYQHWVRNGVLPQARAVRCPAEYEQMAKAWTRLLSMHYGN
jgi:hypothetical protein